MGQQAYEGLLGKILPAFKARMREEKLPEDLEDPLCRVYLALAHWLNGHKQPGKTLVLGVNGAQGSGKSTLCGFLALILELGYGFKVANLSLDDFYLTRAERGQLGCKVHPLLVTRGVPGTHDVDLALRTLKDLVAQAGVSVALPKFDKATDDRRPEAQWPLFKGPADVVLFEGWCMGIRPQSASALVEPVNSLERLEDPAGVWRRHVNQQLKESYARLFTQLDKLAFIQVPDMDCVLQWRGLQEQKLAESSKRLDNKHRLMDAKALRRFIMHYERLTRHALEEMPNHADLILNLNENHRFSHSTDNKP